MRSRIVWMVLGLVVASGFAVWVGAEEPAGKPAVSAQTAPEKIRIDTGTGDKVVPAFTHKDHETIVAEKHGKNEFEACQECHHETRPGQTPQKCLACHTKSEEKDPRTGAPGFKFAFHRQCMYCHMDQRDQPELRKCKTCHGC